MSFVIAKQPVFDKKGHLVAFEVYLRKKGNLKEYPKEVPYNRATFIIVEIISEHGLERVGEGKKIILNVSADSLMNKALSLLEPSKLIIEIIHPQISIGQIVYQNILKIMSDMTNSGTRFSISQDLIQDSFYQEMYKKAHFITTSIHKLSKELELKSRADNKALIITQIETEKDYNRALEVGAFFEGNFLGPPIIQKEIQITQYLKSTLLRVLATIHTAESTKEIAKVISTDVGMSAKILKLVNSAYFSSVREIKDIEQACAMLGLRNLRNFLMVFSINDYLMIEDPNLWKKSLVRAIIAERIASSYSQDISSKAYMMGLFSLIDQIVGEDKASFLKEVKVSQDILDGFTGKNQVLNSILNKATLIEEASKAILSSSNPYSDPLLDSLEKQTQIGKNEIINLAKDAVEKAEYILKL